MSVFLRETNMVEPLRLLLILRCKPMFAADFYFPLKGKYRLLIDLYKTVFTPWFDLLWIYKRKGMVQLKKKKIYKSRDRVLCGVAGGIAEYLGIDAFWIRLCFAFLTLSGGSGAIVYLIAALLMDDDPESSP